jgi:NADPH-dependent glutamate synthase beta subunit-like oxidoreductase
MSNTEAPNKGYAQQAFRTLAQQLEKTPPCQAQCANSGDVRGWLGYIAQHEKIGLTLDEAYDKAWEKLVDRNPLPATIGRICPHPCEDRCSRKDKDGSVSINAMERFLGDWAIQRRLPLPMLQTERMPESIGVVGSGPASISFAFQMARRGYGVTVYEKHALPGGMLRHAIPNYRLPSDVLDAEVKRVLGLCDAVINEVEVGRDVRLDDLRERHSLVFLGLGAQAARELGIPGEVGVGVTSGIEYLWQRKQGAESQGGKRIAVIGGGNTAIDAARMARRDGAEVTLLYRRSQQEMPAAPDEIEDAMVEGVQFKFLVAPTRIIREGNKIAQLEFQNMQLGEADEQGRRRPLPIPGDVGYLPTDWVIVAVSQIPDWHGIECGGDHRSWLRTQEDGKLQDDIWAGGDSRGPGIASRAIAQGRKAAEAAHAELRGEPVAERVNSTEVLQPGMVKPDYYAERQRNILRRRPQQEWLLYPDREIDQTIDYEEARREAERCMSCGLCFDCQQCFMFCNQGGFTRREELHPGRYFALALDACEGCGKCIEICPCGYLEMRS